MKDLRDELKKRAVKVVNPVKQILDENNKDNVILYDEENKPIEFEQIAVIPLNDDLYTILIPITSMQGVNEGEGVLFKIDEEQQDLSIINDEKIIDEVLTIYQKLLEDGDNE